MLKQCSIKQGPILNSGTLETFPTLALIRATVVYCVMVCLPVTKLCPACITTELKKEGFVDKFVVFIRRFIPTLKCMLIR